MIALEPLDVEGLEPAEIMGLITERAESVPGGLEGKIVRLEVRGISRESYRHLDHKELRALRARALHFTLDISFASVKIEGRAIGSPGKGLLKDELKEFSKSWEVPGVASEEIATILDGYVSQVEAKYEAS